MVSKLATGQYEAINFTPGRRDIIGFAIHHMAGNMTAKNLALWQAGFAGKAPNNSCNYAIGSDGDIWNCVDEQNTSWCTSDGVSYKDRNNPKAIDARVITIEVANDGGGPDWHVSDKAIDSLVNLMVDICERYKIPSVQWRADKSYLFDWDRQNLVLHKWLSNTACPGPYLESMMGEIAERVNTRLTSAREDDDSDGVNPLAVILYKTAKFLMEAIKARYNIDKEM